MSPRELLLGSFNAAVAAADPLKIVPPHLPEPPGGRTLVVGAGKAAASMALAVEQHWPADAPLDGTVITRYAHGLLTNRITVVEAGHPVPDEAGAAAAKRILDSVKRLSRDDLLLVLVSGVVRACSACRSRRSRWLISGNHRNCCAAARRSRITRSENICRLSRADGWPRHAKRKFSRRDLGCDGDDPTHVASGPCAPIRRLFRTHSISSRATSAGSGSRNETLARGIGRLAERPSRHKVFTKTEAA